MKLKILTEKFVRRSIIEWLFRNGWGRNLREKETKEHGVDIKVRHNKYPRYFLIETKGESSSKSAVSQRETGFVYCLGQIITRIKGPSRYYYGLGLPESIARIAIRRLPWYVGKELLIFIFSVDNAGKVSKYSWQDLRKVQS